MPANLLAGVANRLAFVADFAFGLLLTGFRSHQSAKTKTWRAGPMDLTKPLSRCLGNLRQRFGLDYPCSGS